MVSSAFNRRASSRINGKWFLTLDSAHESRFFCWRKKPRLVIRFFPVEARGNSALGQMDIERLNPISAFPLKVDVCRAHLPLPYSGPHFACMKNLQQHCL